MNIFKVDEQFIVAWANNYQKPKADILYFISTETLEETRTLCVKTGKYAYGRGQLIQLSAYGVIRVMDVATGTHFNDVHLPFRIEDVPFIEMWDPWASSNSNVMVIAWKYTNKESRRKISHLSVYDLEAVKKRNSDPGRYLLYTLQFQLDVEEFVMNEREIAFSGNANFYWSWHVTVLKFANLSFDERKSSDFKENSEANEDDFKMRIVYDSCVDSYPC